ncbi:MAG: ABC transporter ATP-binding protein [Candidatus Caldarchaeum sp.]|nr:energy-coupling factor ABC transporter ATP-binding protein [Candidatus Caldarchaeales archaeon]
MDKIPIEIKSFWWKYATSEEWVLSDINFSVREGEFVVITGPTGAGKTTLCLTMAGLIPYHYNGTLKGRVYVFGKDTTTLGSSDMASLVGIVFQDPESQFLTMSVEDEIAFGLENLALPLEDMRERVYEAARLVKVEDLLERAPYELSGGQKQRVAIAAALAMKPKVLVLDEPTGQLDPIGKEEVVNVLQSLKKQGITIIVVEHILEELAPFTDRLVVMNGGRILYDGDFRGFFKDAEEVFKSGVPSPQVVELTLLLRRELKKELEIPITLEEAEQMLNKLIPVKKFVQ